MLDTIALTLDRHQFEVRDPDRFSPSAGGLLTPPFSPFGGRAKLACFLNPTKADLEAEGYLPRLTLTRRKLRGGFGVTLRVEFSAPKLIFGNNFDELAARDFERVVEALHRALGSLGVAVATDTLRAAGVSAIHYSKNIAFTDYSTCSMVMGELARADVSRRLDFARTDYRGEGHAIRYHTNSFEVIVYDKLKDIAKARISEKRAVEDDYGAQLHLFKDRSPFPKTLEVLRLEVRLGNRAKIRSVVAPIEPGTEPTFAALFHAGIAKGVLTHYWRLLQGRMALRDGATTERPEDLLARLAGPEAHGARPGALLQQFGLALLVQSVGVRAAGAILSRHCSGRSWQRYRRQLKGIPAAAPAGFSPLRQVDEALARFEPLHLADFRDPQQTASMAVKQS